jgi:hypothetical protein
LPCTHLGCKKPHGKRLLPFVLLLKLSDLFKVRSFSRLRPSRTLVLILLPSVPYKLQ